MQRAVQPDSDPTAVNGEHERGRANVLACVKGESIDIELMGRAQSLTQWLGGRLTVVYAFRLGTARSVRSAIDRDRRYARSIGASLVELPAYSPEDAIAEFGRTRGITHAVLSEDRTTHGTGSDSLTLALVERISGIDVYCIPTRSIPPHAQRPRGDDNQEGLLC
jgi:K+-sensing histidine kinase KdpD